MAKEVRPDALTLARRWAAKHPELASRLLRAVELVTRVTPCDYAPDAFFVEGSKDRYLVKVFRKARSSTCTCPDSEMGNHCKHRLAVALYEVASPQMALF